MSDEKQPVLNLSPSRMMCNRHGEPFRRNWPSGYPLFVIRGFQLLMEQDSTHKESGGETERVPELLDVIPCCCRLPPDKLLGLYHEIHETLSTWVAGECVNCHKIAIGCEYQTMTLNYWGRPVHRTYKHICFECVVYRMMMDPAQAN